MDIKELDYLSCYNENEDYIFAQKKPDYHIHVIKSKINFSTKQEIIINDSYGVPIICKDHFLITTPKIKEIFKVNFSSFTIQKYDSDSTPYYHMPNGNYYGFTKKNDESYHCLMNNKFESKLLFKRPEELYNVMTDYGLLEYTRNNEEKAFISMYNPEQEKYDWKTELEHQISTIKFYKNFGLFVQKVPFGWDLSCINILTGDIIWNKSKDYGGFQLLDSKTDQLINYYNFVLEIIDIPTGKIINRFDLANQNPSNISGRIVALNSEAVYYYSGIKKDNVIGKINRHNGTLDWKETYKPDNHKFLNIYHWYILNNGDHVISAYDSQEPKLLLMKE